MLVVGLTGGIGSGKSIVSQLFAKHHVPMIDADQLTRDIVQPGQPALKKIIDHFGQALLQADGSLNRSQLRDYIFAHPDARIWLENLLHPLVRQAMTAWVKQHEKQALYCIITIPLLFETTPNPLIQRVIVIDCPEELQISRTMQRDHLTREQVLQIMQQQVSRSQRLAGANEIIYNDSDLSHLEKQVSLLHARLIGAQ